MYDPGDILSRIDLVCSARNRPLIIGTFEPVGKLWPAPVLDGIVRLGLGISTLVRKGLYISADDKFRGSKYTETPSAIPGELERRFIMKRTVTLLALQQLSQEESTWPAGNVEIRLDDYMVRPNQEWTITPVANVGGYLGQPFFKITIAGTDRALATTPDGQIVAVPAYTGASEQLLAD